MEITRQQYLYLRFKVEHALSHLPISDTELRELTSSVLRPVIDLQHEVVAGRARIRRAFLLARRNPTARHWPAQQYPNIRFRGKRP